MNTRRNILVTVLKRTQAWVVQSSDSDWAALSVTEIAAVLDREICALGLTGELIDKDELALLFSPTADIQEIAVSNGWHQRYLVLSTIFDWAIARY